MIDLSGFFQKFKQLEFKEIGRREVVAEAIKNSTGIVLNEKALAGIRFEKGRIVLPAQLVSSLERNEIYMKKQVLVKELGIKLAPFIVTDLV